MFDQQVVRTFEKLKGKPVQELFNEHPCMAYDEELMMASAVLSGVKIWRDHFGTNPTVREMIKKGVIGSSLEQVSEVSARQSAVLAAFIALFEHQAEIHRQFHNLRDKKQEEEAVVASRGRQFAIV